MKKNRTIYFNISLIKNLKELAKENIETLLEKRYDVFVVENACGSRNADDKKSALKRLSFAHAQVLTTEMVLFELLTTSQNPKFKEVQALIK